MAKKKRKEKKQKMHICQQSTVCSCVSELQKGSMCACVCMGLSSAGASAALSRCRPGLFVVAGRPRMQSTQCARAALLGFQLLGPGPSEGDRACRNTSSGRRALLWFCWPQQA